MGETRLVDDIITSEELKVVPSLTDLLLIEDNDLTPPALRKCSIASLIEIGGGEANTSSNLGGGEGLATAKVEVDLPFKSLIGGTGITLSSTATEITIDATGGGGSPLTTKGDIFGFDTADARIPVGTNEQILIADSAQGLGVRYGLVNNVNIAVHTSTKITITAKGQLNSAIVYTDQTNTFIAGNLNTFAHDATNPGLAVLPVAGNPTARGDGAIWLNVTSQQLFARINGADVDLGAGAGGGEANTISSLGGGTVITAAVPKSGVDLRTVSIATTAPIAHSVTADLLTFTLNALVNADISATAAIVLTKLQDIATARLLGRQTAATGAIEEISLNATLELVATTTLQRAALTGDVTAPSGSNTTTVANVPDGALSSNVVLINQANVFGDFDQTFKDNRILIESPDGLTPITLVNLQQTLARNLTIPILTGNRTILVSGEGNIVNADINASAAIVLTKFAALTISRATETDGSGFIIASATTSAELALLTGATTLELQANKGTVSGYAGLDGSQELLLANFPTGSGLQVLRRNSGNTALEFATLAGGGDMVLADVQVVTGLKTFNDTRFALRNVADSFSASFVNTISADRIYTLPDAAGTVVITGLANQLTDTELTSGVFGKITGLGTQTQALDLAAQGITVTSRATGDILKDNGTNLQRFARGAADTVLKVNTGGTDLEYGLISDANIAATAEIAVSKLQDGTPGQFIRTDSAGTGVEWTDDIFTINFVIDGGGSLITTGIKGFVTVDFNCEVIEWAILGDASGSLVVEVSAATFTNFPSMTSIDGTEVPTLSSAQKNEDRALAWGTITAGDIVQFEVTGTPATVERVTVALVCRKTG